MDHLLLRINDLEAVAAVLLAMRELLELLLLGVEEVVVIMLAVRR
jgi:hypothetical protein